MGKYIVKRIILLIPTVLIVCLLVFIMMRCLPGSAVDALLYKLQAAGDTSATRESVEAMLGLDQSAFTQFFSWLGGVLKGDLGDCFFQKETVAGVISRQLVPSLELGFLILIISNLISIPLGVYCAANQDSIPDHTIRIISLLLMSIPIFWIATVILIYPAIWWRWSPPTEYVHFFEHPIQNLKMFIVPALLGALTNCGMQLRYVRTVTLETMRADYVRTARAKGVPQRKVLFHHALRNSLLPVITLVGGSVAALVGGSIILESLYSIPGIGALVVTALGNRDYPLVQGCVLVFSIIVMLVNLIVDVLYKVFDPRITLE
ncbi:MAG: ABC transporter permease [Oscillospiraceae bacterium]